ncbi:CaiF/GrlA family transcriptional regulator [Salmonella enterica subsp. enterica]|nr:CaiF/GrlA family transcriptional regulator [Salmonella enterica subsp. enterica]
MKTDKKKYNNKVINTAEYAEDKVNSSGFLMKCSQSNHEECRVPADTQPRDNEPLYLVIARWCQPQNRWITPDDIAAAFYLTAHQVSLQLSYLSQKKIELPVELVSMLLASRNTIAMKYGVIV